MSCEESYLCHMIILYTYIIIYRRTYREPNHDTLILTEQRADVN